MSDPFIGEIKIWAFPWAPRGWALCDGTILTIQQNTALYSLLGTQFGGDGKTTFALPDLRGRTPVGTTWGTSVGGAVYETGTVAGAETVTLSSATVLSHVHSVNAYAVDGNAPFPAGADFGAPVPGPGATANFSVYSPDTTQTVPNPAVLASGTVAVAGSNLGHNNMQPYGVVNFCIAIQGNYPQRP